MKLKNVGKKIISVGKKVLMPEDEMEYSGAITPAIRALIDLKNLEVVANVVYVPAEDAVIAPAENAEAEPQSTAEPSKEPVKKTKGRKSAKSDAE